MAQLRAEEWLSAVPPPYPLQSPQVNGQNGVTNGDNNLEGKELYGKVLEVYCISLLPRNEEWDFAKEFIQLSAYLSPQKKQVLPLLMIAHEELPQ